MKQGIRWSAAALAVIGAIGLAQAQGGGSAGGSSSGTPAAGSGTPGSGTPASPTPDTKAGMASGKGHSADNGPGVRSSPDTSGTATHKKKPVKHSHAKRAHPADGAASDTPRAQVPGG